MEWVLRAYHIVEYATEVLLVGENLQNALEYHALIEPEPWDRLTSACHGNAAPPDSTNDIEGRQ